MGVSDSIGTVAFANNNPLQFWKTDNETGVNRRPFFNTADAPPGLRTEAQTLALGTTYVQFRGPMEGNPHGSAHTSFGGLISSTTTAPRDPLFFLLHCNVDRLWAKWQRANSRFNPAIVASFNNNMGDPIGHRLADTMWPWNGVTGGTRPPNGAGWHNGAVADRHGAGTVAARTRHAGLPRRHQLPRRTRDSTMMTFRYNAPCARR